MCGIFAYVGEKDAAVIALEGLQRLEYRGYDSAGIAGTYDGELICKKVVGKVAALRNLVLEEKIALSSAIAHTRWATHGKPSYENAHPHLSGCGHLAVVHNGIVENLGGLRQMLLEEGVQFISETDSEVIAHLISHFSSEGLLSGVRRALPLLEGSFAIAVVDKNSPGKILAVAKESPLVVGIGEGEAYLSSDIAALPTSAKEILRLHGGEVAVVTAEQVETFDCSLNQIFKTRELLASHREEAEKEGHRHYTIKEILEQPATIRRALSERLVPQYGTAMLEGLPYEMHDLASVRRVLLLGCGTSFHAASLAASMIEELARVPVEVEISSEYRYKNPIVEPGTLVVAISQSGETADTLAAVRELKAKGAKILALCNVHGSALTLEAHGTLFLRCGPEIGVCSTKAFTSQVAVLACLALQFARVHHMDKERGQQFVEALQALPGQVQEVCDMAGEIRVLAEKYADLEHFFFIGRRYMYTTALEGALKLKEIAYVNANGYAAGELKHGPIALLGEKTPIIALCSNRVTYQKMINNIREVQARGAPVVAFAPRWAREVEEIAEDTLYLPDTMDPLASVLTGVALQLFAYYFALKRGAEIDQPRNLAKSVTVE